MVGIGWEMATGLDIMSKICLCGVKLHEWGDGVSNEYKLKVHNCRLLLRKLRSRNDVQGIQRYNATRWEYLKLLEIEV